MCKFSSCFSFHLKRYDCYSIYNYATFIKSSSHIAKLFKIITIALQSQSLGNLGIGLLALTLAFTGFVLIQ